jgi:hypothetical protein
VRSFSFLLGLLVQSAPIVARHKPPIGGNSDELVAAPAAFGVFSRFQITDFDGVFLLLLHFKRFLSNCFLQSLHLSKNQYPCQRFPKTSIELTQSSHLVLAAKRETLTRRLFVDRNRHLRLRRMDIWFHSDSSRSVFRPCFKAGTIVDLISDVLLPFGGLWYDGPNAVVNAIG